MAVRLTFEIAMRKNKNSPLAKSTDFSLFTFTNTRTKSVYFCTKHKIKYEALPSNFWNGHGCSQCGEEKRVMHFPKTFKMKIRKTNDQIISEFKKIHGPNRYSYKRVNYVKNNLKVEIVCPKKNHGVFTQTPNKHLMGRGCPKCANETRNTNTKSNIEEFIKLANKAHKNYYDYSESIYRGALEYIDIICPEHGKFSQKASDHIHGHGCKFCAAYKNSQRLFKTNDDFIEQAREAHGEFYDYSKVNYQGIFKKVVIVCPIHKEFIQIANVHLRGGGCPKCSSSKGEKMIAKLLDRFAVNYKQQYKFQDCRFKLPLPFDFFLLEQKICIEYQGIQHYLPKPAWGGEKAFAYLCNNDKLKRAYCKKSKIKLIEIPYTMSLPEVEALLQKELSIEMKIKK